MGPYIICACICSGCPLAASHVTSTTMHLHAVVGAVGGGSQGLDLLWLQDVLHLLLNVLARAQVAHQRTSAARQEQGD